MSKFHRISATPAIKRRAREEEREREILTDVRGVSTRVRAISLRLHSPRSRIGIQSLTTAGVALCTPEYALASPFRVSRTPALCQGKKKREREGKLQSSAQRARVLCAAHDPCNVYVHSARVCGIAERNIRSGNPDRACRSPNVPCSKRARPREKVEFSTPFETHRSRE